jgi:hypothetical protein
MIRSVFKPGPLPIRSYICIALQVYQAVFQEHLKLMTYMTSENLILKYPSDDLIYAVSTGN